MPDNFGIVYSPPPWRAGIGGEGSSNSVFSDSPKGSQQHLPTGPSSIGHKKRQKSFGADSPEVVTIGKYHIQRHATLTYHLHASAQITSDRIGKPSLQQSEQQLQDVLTGASLCVSGRVHALSPEEAGGESSDGNGSGSRRSRRRQQNPGNPFEQYLGQDLEELMVMEAMRLSLLEHEEQQRKEAEDKKKKKGKAGKSESGGSDSGPSNAAGASSSAAAVSTSTNTNSSDTPSSTPSSTSSAGPSQNSLQVGQPSGSRSPSPAAGAQESASNGLNQSNNTSSTPPFSTLAAAMSTTSTASAFLANNRNESPSGAGPSTAVVHDGNADSLEDTSPPRPDISSESVASTLAPQTPGSYEQLPSNPSSPEMSFQEPLIPKKVQGGENHAEYVF
ncbi:SNF1-interacting protein [Marasmius crinis-equi]|uniref:SNF1-interacting protein n=1 Tax=Marasmius crinis-equi TaxID=585013 RepID=A0ABR3FXY2_9AGAR